MPRYLLVCCVCVQTSSQVALQSTLMHKMKENKNKKVWEGTEEFLDKFGKKKVTCIAGRENKH